MAMTDLERMDELEDGEIKDSGSDMNLKKKKNSHPRIKVPGLSSDDESEYSSDDGVPTKRQFSSSTKAADAEFINPLKAAKDSGFACDQNYWLDGAYQSMTPATAGKKVNNIWGSVLEETALTAEIAGLQNDEVAYEHTLGVESYDYTRAKFDQRPYKQEEEEVVTKEHDSATDLLDKESFGMEKRRKPKRISIKERLGKRPPNDSSEDGEHENEDGDNRELRISVKDRLGVVEPISTDDDAPRKTVKERLGSMNSDSSGKDRVGTIHQNSPVDPDMGEMDCANNSKTPAPRKKRGHSHSDGGKSLCKDNQDRFPGSNRKRSHRGRNPGQKKSDLVQYTPIKHIEIDVNQPEEVIVEDVVESLGEPCDQKIIIGRLVKLCGTEKVISLLRATEDVEEMGGLAIQDGSRRRTPGGVFFFLLKNDKDVSKETMDEVFKEQREKWKEGQREQKRERKRRARERKRKEKARKEGVTFKDELATYIEEKKKELMTRVEETEQATCNAAVASGDGENVAKEEGHESAREMDLDSMPVKHTDMEHVPSHGENMESVIPSQRMILENREEDDLFDSYAENIELL